MIFPDPCGKGLGELVDQGADPESVVPDAFYVIRRGATDIDPRGGTFSCTVGPTLDSAAFALPHGKIRVTTVGAIRSLGGIVRWVLEKSRHGTINRQHVDVVLQGPHLFSELQTNPVPKNQRIDGDIESN